MIKPKTTQIKICGLRNLKDTQKCIDLEVEYLGFNFFAKSPRYISVDKFVNLLSKIKFKTAFRPKIVAVLVDANQDFIQKILETDLVDILQFHGEETPEFINLFRDKIEIWKVFTFKKQVNKNNLQKDLEKEFGKYQNIAQKYILDLPKKTDFSSGIGKFEDLETFKLFQKKYSLILAGGLNNQNIQFYLSQLNPEIVDVASGVENNLYQKDWQKLEDFVYKIRNFSKT